MLFHEASRVETHEIAVDTETTVQHHEVYEDGYETDYFVWTKPQAEKRGGKEQHRSDECHVTVSRDTLRLSLDTLRIHHVDRVQCKTHKYRVARHVQTEQDFDHF